MCCQCSFRTAYYYNITYEHNTSYFDPFSAKKYRSKILAAYQRRDFHALALAQAPLLYEINSDCSSGDTFTVI